MSANDCVEVMRIGSAVLVGPSDDMVHATISGVLIRGIDNVQYECVWWDGKTRKAEWCNAVEVVPADKKALKRIQIGFTEAVTDD